MKKKHVTDPLTGEIVLDILKQYQKWRKGGSKEMVPPRLVTMALDWIIKNKKTM